MSKIRQRTKNLIKAGVIGAVVMGLIAAGAVGMLIKHHADEKRALRAEYEQRLQEAEELLAKQKALKKTVVVAAGELKAGKKLTDSDLKTVEVPESEAPVNLVQNKKDLVGKVIKIDVGENTPIIDSMVFDEGPMPKDLRLHEYNVIMLPTKLEKGQYVDVRINFPTGEDFIVLSKKKVHDFVGTTVWYEINESELLVMSSAIVDAYLHGAKLYAITYVDPFMQEEAIPTYPPNIKVLDLIQSDPNVLEKAIQQLSQVARKNLETNLSQLSDVERMKIQNGSAILQQEVANNQIKNQQSMETARQTQSGGTQQNSNTSSQQQVSDTTWYDTEVPKEEIVKPINAEDDESSIEKQREIFEQPLVR